jgi:hypothetical protein
MAEDFEIYHYLRRYDVFSSSQMHTCKYTILCVVKLFITISMLHLVYLSCKCIVLLLRLNAFHLSPVFVTLLV